MAIHFVAKKKGLSRFATPVRKPARPARPARPTRPAPAGHAGPQRPDDMVTFKQARRIGSSMKGFETRFGGGAFKSWHDAFVSFGMTQGTASDIIEQLVDAGCCWPDNGFIQPERKAACAADIIAPYLPKKGKGRAKKNSGYGFTVADYGFTVAE